METHTDRVTRYLLRRIRRLAVLDLYQHAAVAGLLDELAYDVGGRAGPTLISRWAPTVELMHLLSLGPQGKEILSRRLGHAGPGTEISLRSPGSPSKHPWAPFEKP